MKRTHRIPAFLAACVMLTVCLCGGAALADEKAQQPAGGMELPVGSFAELCAQVPDVPLKDAPAGASDVAYAVVGSAPTMAQIRFRLLDRSYCYRAARFSNSASMPDISGMTNQFDQSMELGGVLYRQDTAAGAGVASWYFESTHSQYCVSVQQLYDAEYMRQVAVSMRAQSGVKPQPTPQPVPQPADASKTGTVSSVSDSHISILTAEGVRYTFGIDAATENPYSTNTLRGSYVRVWYNAPYERYCRAVSITKLAAPEPLPTKKPVSNHATRTGTIIERCGDTLKIRRPSGNVYTFFIGCATLAGDTWAGVGDKATVRYYMDDWGTKVATKVTFTATVYTYDPCPVPNPCPDPYWQNPCSPYVTSCPVPETHLPGYPLNSLDPRSPDYNPFG